MRALLSCLVITLACASIRVSAQVEDDGYCHMLASVGEHRPTRVGEVESGTTGPSSVSFRRTVARDASYLLIVSLSAAATSAAIEPADRVGSEAPRREGTRVAHDFVASTRGAITISFHAPAGTAYHAALFRLTPRDVATLSVRPSAIAVSGMGGIGSLRPADERPHPPDCHAPLPARLGGRDAARTDRGVRIGRLVIRGSMPRAEITRVLEGARGQLGFCAEENGGTDVRITFVISPAGTVVSASADGGRPALAGCLIRAARRWRFPSTGAGVTMVEVPLSFGT